MEIEISDEEIKEKVIQKMKENKSFERIEDEYRFAVSMAMDEEQNYNPFKNSDKNESLALQFVFQYLKQKGLQFTLSCLLDESISEINENLQLIDISQLIQNFKPSHDQKNHSYFVEPPKKITKSEFNNFKYIVKVEDL
ncbi:hypothetical protein M9Y10_004978 [Tritrichomonas musculus]|uniref:LisH domain-containing protein n=1 Tax=Tritrichomonas musculus TaxID=1915356 RepID=A0ABR2JLC6_9EUKA